MRLLLCLLLAAATPASAQTFERFGVRDGLPSELIHDLALGPDGALWIGTDDGLARYDGHGFRVWRADAGTPGTLPSSLVLSVMPVDGGVWVGTTRGLAFLNLRTGLAETITSLPPRSVPSLALDTRGRVWVGTATDGLWRYSPGEGTTLRARLAPEGTREPRRTMVVAADGASIWVQMEATGVRSLVCRVDPDRAACADEPLAFGRTLLEDDGQAVLTTYDGTAGVGVLDWLDVGDRWTMPIGTLGDAYRSVLRLDATHAWLRTTAALTNLRPGESGAPIVAAPTRRGGLGGYDARALARDRQGNVWIGTEAGLYLSRRPARLFETITSVPDDPATLSDDRVNGLAQDAGGALWITTNDGLNRLDLATGKMTRLAARLPDAGPFGGATERAFWQVLPLGDRVLVGAKRGGLVEVRDGRVRRVLLPGFSPTQGVRSLALGPNGRIWAGTNTGLFRTDADGDFQRVEVPTSLEPVSLVYTSRKGDVWLGTDSGVFRLTGDAWTQVARGTLCAPIVWSMTETPEDPGALWIATVDGGLGRLDLASGHVECLTVRDGLPTNSVYGVVPDGRGALWASTASGLARIDLATRDIVTFTSGDGLAGDAFNLMAQLRLADGRIAFGGPSGLTIVDPAASIARAAPDVAITGVERLGRLLPGVPASGAVLRLAHDQGAFGVRFSAMDFRAPRRNRYRYRLVGLDDGWQSTDGTAPRAAFAGVPPGRYRFEVQGAAADTPFSETAAVLVVEVVPAWWQRRLIQILVLLLALGLGSAVWLDRRRHRRRAHAQARRDRAEVRRRLANARERERASLARDLHDGPVQTLYRVGHDLDDLGGGDAEPVRGRVDAVASELRQMMTELRPTLVEHLGLGAALRTLARRTEDRFPDLSVTVDDPSRAEPPPAAGLALFRIAQEALQNAGRHAGPAHVTLELTPDGDALRLTIRDDGRGFIPKDPILLARAQHFGLIGARERAEAVGGTLVVNSTVGIGTAVTARVPTQDAPDDDLPD